VTAFNTVWTYDIYQSYINPDKSDKHYLRVAQLTTIFGVVVSIGTAYMARFFNNIMDFLQLVFAFINAPLFATFVLGMFWKRATGHGAFYGLVAGTLAAAVHHGLTRPEGSDMLIKGGWLGTVAHHYPSEMAQNFWTAIYAFTACLLVTIIISVSTKQLKSRDQLTGLVWALTPRIKEEGVPWYRSPEILAVIIGIIAIALTIYWW
jgi:SSS family solute:Na+ symporter